MSASLKEQLRTYSNQILTVIGVIAGLLGIVSSISFAFSPIREPEKDLNISIVREARLIQTDSPRVEFEILYQGKPVENVSTLTLVMENTGKSAITPEDWSEPIQVKITNPNMTLLDATVVDSVPEDLDLVPEIASASTIRIQPTLLNPGDRATVYFLLSGDESSEPVVHGTIEGVKPIVLRTSTSQDAVSVLEIASQKSLVLLTGFASSSAAFIGIWLYFRPLHRRRSR